MFSFHNLNWIYRKKVACTMLGSETWWYHASQHTCAKTFAIPLPLNSEGTTVCSKST